MSALMSMSGSTVSDLAFPGTLMEGRVGTDLADLASRVNARLATVSTALRSFDVVGAGDGQWVAVAYMTTSAAIQPWIHPADECELFLSDTLTLQELIDAHVGPGQVLYFSKVASAPQGSRRVSAIVVWTDPSPP